jgi:hypothetical protein
MAAAPSSVPAFYTCTFPGCPAPVRVALSVVRSLQENAQGQQGILYGELTDGGSQVRRSSPLAVFGIEPVRAAIAESRDSVIGFFRVYDGTSFDLTPEDLAIGAAHFSKPGCVILLVARSSRGAEGCFFFSESGTFLNAPLLTFPLDAERLEKREEDRLEEIRAEEASSRRSAPAAVAFEPAAPAPASAAPALIRMVPRAAPRRAPSRKVWIAIAAAAFLLPTAYYVSRQQKVLFSPVTRPGTPLRAERQGDDLRITWDLNATSVAGATSGLLEIEDGGKKRQIVLSADEVRYGSILYTPLSDQVSLHLTTAIGQQATTRASVLALLKKSPGDGKPGFVAAPSEASRSDAFVRKTPVKTVREFLPPATASQPAPVTTIEDLPAVQPRRETLDLSKLPVGSVAPPPAKVEKETAKPQQTVAVTPPVVTFQSAMITPPELRPLLARRVNISVRVDLDDKGRVIRAAPVAEKGIHALLLKSATEAAMRCHFQPARLGQTAVQGSIVLVFSAGGISN